MNPAHPLERAIGEWQRKPSTADGDPMIAALDLVRVYLEHNRDLGQRDATTIPSFEDFRGTIELLDRRSKSFINQASDLVADVRRFGQYVERLHWVQAVTVAGLIAMDAAVGFRLTSWILVRL